MIYINLLIITAIICFILDVSGFMQSIKRLYLKKVFKLSNPDPTTLNWKPFDCSLCSTWWIGIIYLLLYKELTIINLGYVAMLALLASNISEFEQLVKDYISSFQIWLQKLIS